VIASAGASASWVILGSNAVSVGGRMASHCCRVTPQATVQRPGSGTPSLSSRSIHGLKQQLNGAILFSHKLFQKCSPFLACLHRKYRIPEMAQCSWALDTESVQRHCQVQLLNCVLTAWRFDGLCRKSGKRSALRRSPRPIGASAEAQVNDGQPPPSLVAPLCSLYQVFLTI
jgi:hypothetical protein